MLVLLLVASVVLFGGVYLWSAAVLAAGVAGLLLWTRPRLARQGWPAALDWSLVALLAGIGVQILPLPAGLISFLSPARAAYLRTASLQPDLPSWLPLTLDRAATAHALIATFCAVGAFWAARAILARGGIRTVITAIAWTAVALVVVAFAQSASETTLVYGVWRPMDAGARPLGPFINRNHFGTWALLAIFLCYGCFQWRRVSSAPAHGWSWRARLAHALNGRSVVLVLAVILLAAGVALGASRSTILALSCASGYVAWVAGPRRATLWPAALALAAAFAVVAFTDLDRLLSRVDETRRLGPSPREAIWGDALGVVRGFPLAGAGAGNFSNAMRHYQTGDRAYFWNDAHSHYLQVAAEGGLLLVIPAGLALIAVAVLAWRTLRRRDDPLLWMRIGASTALVAVAIQSIWETGLTLPASGMLAAVATAILVQESRHRHAAPRP